jgi:hypothetical protein
MERAKRFFLRRKNPEEKCASAATEFPLACFWREEKWQEVFDFSFGGKIAGGITPPPYRGEEEFSSTHIFPPGAPC